MPISSSGDGRGGLGLGGGLVSRQRVRDTSPLGIVKASSLFSPKQDVVTVRSCGDYVGDV